MSNRLKSYVRRTILAAAKAKRPYTLADYSDERGGGPAECALIGLRFAVEWYAGEVAQELCPDF